MTGPAAPTEHLSCRTLYCVFKRFEIPKGLTLNMSSTTLPTCEILILVYYYVYWTVHPLDSWIKRDQLDVTCFFISLCNAQHVLYVNTSITRSLRLICWVISWVVRGVAIKKPDSCSKPLLKKKIRQSKCYPLQRSPLPDPYTAPCKFSTVGSSAAGHLVLSCSRIASILLSLHPRTRTWFLWAQTWFLGREKSRMVLGPKGTWMFHHWNVAFRQIPLHR